jgi:hypothetical protein
LIHTEHEGSKARTAEQKAGNVERTPFARAMILDVGEHEREADNPNRDVEKEDQPPRCKGGDEAAERRTQYRRHEAGRRDVLHQPDQIALVAAAHHHQPAHRHHHRAADALQHARRDEREERVREAAQHRRTGEHDDRERKHRARAEPVGEPPARRNEHGERDQVRRHADAHVDRILVEGARHRRQRRRDDRAVEHLHEHRAPDDQRDEHRAPLGCEEAEHAGQCVGKTIWFVVDVPRGQRDVTVFIRV